MNKNEAIEAMKAGKKVTHRYFSNDEWVTSTPNGLVYTFEDGNSVTSVLFWSDRNHEGWEDDWELYEDNP